MLILNIADIQRILKTTGLTIFYQQLIDQLEVDFKRWQAFDKSPRHAIHYPNGVIELMPCSDDTLYSFKYVNGHPANPLKGKLSVVAVGLLADATSGYPLMMSEMTLLTALRTAATSALASKYLAKQNSQKLAIIGTGAQSEFQAIAIKSQFSINEIKIFDIDPSAMDKFHQNMQHEFTSIKHCQSTAEAVSQADIIITTTAAMKNACLFTENDIAEGTHINAMGGDGPGKTELNKNLLKKAKLVVEYSEQSLKEGEIQQLDESYIYAELWQIINQSKPGRTHEKEITLFDCVGFAIEDFSILNLMYKLAKELDIGTDLNIIPELDDPKNLYSLLNL